MLRIGVTGIGGACGQSILKALSLNKKDLCIVGLDIKEGAGNCMIDEFHIVPNLKDQKELSEQYLKILYMLDLNAFIPGSDYDICPIAKGGLETMGIIPLVSRYELAFNCYDKLRTHRMLAEHKLSTAFVHPNPLVVKPRFGSGSQGITYYAMNKDILVQNYILGEEYTCSVFCDRNGEPIATFMMKRQLKDGATVFAEVCFDQEIHDLLMDVGSKLKPLGPLNVQLRKPRNGKPVIIELNCRCSGTTAIRAFCGYNEPRWLIDHFVLGKKIDTSDIKRTGTFYRFYTEAYIDDKEVINWWYG